MTDHEVKGPDHWAEEGYEMGAMMNNCSRCGRLHRDDHGRGLCPACFGQKIFGKPALDLRAPEPKHEPRTASSIGLNSPEHLLRCEIYARKGLAHAGGVHRGCSSHWAPRA